MVHKKSGADDASKSVEEIVQIYLCVVFGDPADVEVSVLDSLAGRSGERHLWRQGRGKKELYLLIYLFNLVSQLDTMSRVQHSWKSTGYNCYENEDNLNTMYKLCQNNDMNAMTAEGDLSPCSIPLSLPHPHPPSPPPPPPLPFMKK